TGADAHLHRVAAAVGVEHLLAIERDLHRAPSTDREERGRELVAEGIALPAEGATVRCRDDADARAGKLEHLLELAMEVMRDLRRGPEGELVVRAVGRDRAVRLDRRVRVPLEEEPVVAHMVGARKARIEVAEREVNLFEDVRTATLFMDLHVLALERLLDREDR